MQINVSNMQMHRTHQNQLLLLFIDGALASLPPTVEVLEQIMFQIYNVYIPYSSNQLLAIIECALASIRSLVSADFFIFFSNLQWKYTVLIKTNCFAVIDLLLRLVQFYVSNLQCNGTHRNNRLLLSTVRLLHFHLTGDVVREVPDYGQRPASQLRELGVVHLQHIRLHD